MAKDKVKKGVRCEKCSSDKVSKANDSDRHYCLECGHIFVPGLNAENRPDVVLKKALQENNELKTEINKVRKELKEQGEKFKELEKQLAEAMKVKAQDVFS